MQHALSKSSYDIHHLTADLTKPEDNCEDLKSRWRCNNVRMMDAPEGPDTSTTTALAVLLKKAFGLDRNPFLGCSHRILQAKPKHGEQLRTIVCRFHYHCDCVDILCYVRVLRDYSQGCHPNRNFVALMVLGRDYFPRRGFTSLIMALRREGFCRRDCVTTVKTCSIYIKFKFFTLCYGVIVCLLKQYHAFHYLFFFCSSSSSSSLSQICIY